MPLVPLRLCTLAIDAWELTAHQAIGPCRSRMALSRQGANAIQSAAMQVWRLLPAPGACLCFPLGENGWSKLIHVR